LEVSYLEIQSSYLSGSPGKNISDTGICIPLIHFSAAGSLLELEIHSADFKGSVKTVAQVAWIEARSKGKHPFEAGLKFVNLLATELKTIHAYIACSAAQGGEQEIRWLD